jgi:hypothetical protein
MTRWMLIAAVAAPLWSQHRMEILLERREGNTWKTVDPGLVLEHNDRVRFRVKTNFGGYLYVLNRSTSGKQDLLFPTKESGEKNRIEAERQYLVPETAGAFRITGPAGQEIVYWLVSPVEFQKEEREYVPLPPPPKPGKTPPNLTPRCDDTVLRARGDCVDTSAGARPVKGPQKTTPPEVMFVRQAQTSVVTTPAALEGPVIFEFRLAHR